MVKLPTFYAEDSAASANEVWSRLHSDPLFAVSRPASLILNDALSQPREQDWSANNTTAMPHVDNPLFGLVASLSA